MLAILQPALIIFILRVVDMTLYTMRIFMVTRGRKAGAWIFGFCQAVVYVIAIQAVISNFNNWFNILGYSAGFATGLVAGIIIERRLALGHLLLRIISARHGMEIAEQLRGEGFAVTEIPAHGKDGMVSLLICNIFRRHLDRVLAIITSLDEAAFVTAEEVTPLQRGFWRGRKEPVRL
jgi:uncharacterized protein YebE (UPF0316 family)